jgi:hypothetical protein
MADDDVELEKELLDAQEPIDDEDLEMDEAEFLEHADELDLPEDASEEEDDADLKGEETDSDLEEYYRELGIETEPKDAADE